MPKILCGEKRLAYDVRRKIIMKILLGAVAALAGCAPQPLSEQFQGDWQGPTPDVMRILAKNGVLGCGEFYQKPNSISSEVVVACTADGVRWTGHLVLMASEDVIGPDPTLVNQVGGPPVRE